MEKTQNTKHKKMLFVVRHCDCRACENRHCRGGFSFPFHLVLGSWVCCFDEWTWNEANRTVDDEKIVLCCECTQIKWAWPLLFSPAFFYFLIFKCVRRGTQYNPANVIIVFVEYSMSHARKQLPTIIFFKLRKGCLLFSSNDMHQAFYSDSVLLRLFDIWRGSNNGDEEKGCFIILLLLIFVFCSPHRNVVVLFAWTLTENNEWASIFRWSNLLCIDGHRVWLQPDDVCIFLNETSSFI